MSDHDDQPQDPQDGQDGQAPQQDGPTGTKPPQDIIAEQSVLGAMLISTDAIGEVVEALRGPDFYRPAHEAIYDAIVDLYGAGEPADMVTVGGYMQRAGTLQRAGGVIYLHHLAEVVPLAGNAAAYAEDVRQAAVLRRLAEAGQRITQWAHAGTDDADAILDRAQAEIMDATPNRGTSDYQPVADVLTETIDQIEAAGGDQVTGVPTGFLDLDDLVGGWMPGQMIIVAARPAIGKSTLAMDFCRAASLGAGMTSAFFSLEMTRQEITTRLISAQARVPLKSLRDGRMSDQEWQKVAGVIEPISAAPFFIDDSPNMTMTEIRAKARRLKQRHDLRLIVIDYMQLMTSGRKVESRQVEVSEFSRQIKLLAKELEVPIVALSQLNRGPEQRTDKRPLMSDLRESGSLEQDADIIILLSREDAYDKESTRPGEADLIVAKHRNGATRDVTVAFQGHYSRFADMAHG